MIRTNSKKAIENIRHYITENSNGENYGLNFDGLSFENLAKELWKIFYKEALQYDKRTEFKVFEDWASGLPSCLDTKYYYKCCAVDDLGAILEESETEKAKYTEEQAESMMTKLIYRELKKYND